MSYYPLILGVGRPTAPLDPKFFQPVLSDEDYTRLKEKVFERDQHTCQCCGFQAVKYQQVLHKNFHQNDYRMDNLMTVCNFCYPVFHLEKAAEHRSGTLIWLPEISQATLNHIIRAIYVARISQGPMADAANKAFDLLMERRHVAIDRLGTDDPGVVTQILEDFLELNEYKERAQKLAGLRLLPLDRSIMRDGDFEFNQFPQFMAFWRSKKGPFGNALPKSWPAMFEIARSTVENKASQNQAA